MKPRVKFSKQQLFSIMGGIYCLFLFAIQAIRIIRDNNFWYDELFSIDLAHMTVPDLVSATAADVHPPLYYLFIKLLYDVMGDFDGITYHLGSLLPYGALLLFSYVFLWRKIGKIATVIFVTFLSFTYEGLNYITEARMYSLAALFVTMTYCFFYQILKENKNRAWVLFVLASLGAAYTHYYALISVAFFYIMLALYILVKRKQEWKKLLITLGGDYRILAMVFRFAEILRTSKGRLLDEQHSGLADVPEISFPSQGHFVLYMAAFIAGCCG